MVAAAFSKRDPDSPHHCKSAPGAGAFWTKPPDPSRILICTSFIAIDIYLSRVFLLDAYRSIRSPSSDQMTPRCGALHAAADWDVLDQLSHGVDVGSFVALGIEPTPQRTPPRCGNSHCISQCAEPPRRFAGGNPEVPDPQS